MRIELDRDEVQFALILHVFARTGIRLENKDIEIEWVHEDGKLLRAYVSRKSDKEEEEPDHGHE